MKYSKEKPANLKKERRNWKDLTIAEFDMTYGIWIDAAIQIGAALFTLGIVVAVYFLIK